MCVNSLLIISLLFKMMTRLSFFFFQAEDGIRDGTVTGVQTCALPILILDLERIDRPGQERFEARICYRLRIFQGFSLETEIIKFCEILPDPGYVGLVGRKRSRVVLRKLYCKARVEVSREPFVRVRNAKRV